jgi:translation elongation factor EF-Ts
MMTRKDYVATSAIFEKLVENMSEDGFDAVADAIEEMANYFSNDNKGFDRKRFYSACGVDIQVNP